MFKRWRILRSLQHTLFILLVIVMGQILIWHIINVSVAVNNLLEGKVFSVKQKRIFLSQDNALKRFLILLENQTFSTRRFEFL